MPGLIGKCSFAPMPSVTCKNIVITDKDPEEKDAAERICVYDVSISLCSALMQYEGTVLSANEHLRAAGYHHDHDRRRFIITRVALRLLLARHTGMQPGKIIFQQTENQKPCISSADKPVFYNISHSGDLIVIAVANQPVGIDIEHLRQDFNTADVLGACFSADEQLHIQHAKDGISAFYRLWTRKEALLKATGKGVDDDMINVPALDGVHEVAAGVIGSAESWVVQSMDRGAYICSVAGKHGGGYIMIMIEEFVAE